LTGCVALWIWLTDLHAPTPSPYNIVPMIASDMIPVMASVTGPWVFPSRADRLPVSLREMVGLCHWLLDLRLVL
jgi:hypothetical protein